MRVCTPKKQCTNCLGEEVYVKYVLVAQPRGFLIRSACRMLLLSKLLAKQDEDLN